MAVDYRLDYQRYQRYYLNLKRFYQKPVAKVSIFVVISFMTVSFFSVFAIKPTLTTIGQLVKEIEDKGEINTKMDSKLADLARAQAEYGQIRNEVDLVWRAIPDRPEMARLTIAVNVSVHQINRPDFVSQVLAVLKDSGAEAIIIIENFATTLEKVVANTPVKHVVVAAMGDLLGGLKGMLVNFVVRRVKKMVPAFSLPNSVRFNDAVAQGAGMTLKAVPRTREDVAFLQYTGGTTGVSKGATLLNRNIIANMLQVEAWMQPAINTHTDEQNNFVCALPLYHIFALTVCNMIGMRTGSCNLLIPNPRDIPGFVKELSTFKFNVFPCLNTLFNALANNPEFAKLDFSTLKISLGGGMATQRPVAERWMALTGSAIVEGYGLSETSPVATCNVANLKGFTGTIGLPVSSTEIAIRDEEGKDLPLGESGEICIRGPQVMAGYWNRPDETANVMTADGFFKSGDVGIMDEQGATRIVDRKKDMVLVSGFNVYPSEVEEVAMHHPGVLEAAAIGVPDEHSGEVVKLFIVKKDPTLTEGVLQEFLKEQLTGYKRPKYIEFRTDLPKTPVGKILRRELRPKS